MSESGCVLLLMLIGISICVSGFRIVFPASFISPGQVWDDLGMGVSMYHEVLTKHNHDFLKTVVRNTSVNTASFRFNLRKGGVYWQV